jgi:hypothetical protein
MPKANYELAQTSEGHWDVVSGGGPVVVGTITKHGAEFNLRDAQNLSVGSFPTLDEAVHVLAGA